MVFCIWDPSFIHFFLYHLCRNIMGLVWASYGLALELMYAYGNTGSAGVVFFSFWFLSFHYFIIFSWIEHFIGRLLSLEYIRSEQLKI